MHEYKGVSITPHQMHTITANVLAAGMVTDADRWATGCSKLVSPTIMAEARVYHASHMRLPLIYKTQSPLAPGRFINIPHSLLYGTQ